MASNIFSSAVSGMNAAQIGLAITQHNITNASTPGFTRQQVLVGARPGDLSGSGFVGQGVDVAGVQRIYSDFLTTQVRQEQTQASYLNTYNTAIQQINNLFADPAAGVAPAMQSFFDAANGVASNPESIPARQTLLGTGQSVVNRFHDLDRRLTDITTGINQQISSSVNSINTYSRQIAALNVTIKRAIATGSGNMPNDLLDQRDQIINKLNQEIKVNVQNQSDGTVDVSIGTGQTLVIAEQAMSLSMQKSATDPTKLEVSYQSLTGPVAIQQSSLQGGNLGAYLAFRDQNLIPARNELGRVALGLADAINQQNKLGQDLNGALGANLFSVIAPRINANVNNAGNALLAATVTDVAAVTTSDYQLNFDGANYSVTRLSDNTVTSLGASLSAASVVDGVTFTLASGTMAAGDSFVVTPTANAARDIGLLTNDPNKVAAAAPMRATAALTNIGSGRISSGVVSSGLPLNANLQSPVSITFTSPTTFDVVGAGTGNPTGLTYPMATGSISYNGWTVNLTGTPAAGDVFNVATNSSATGDSRNALLMAAAQTQNTLSNGTASLQSTYSQLVFDVGAKTQELGITSQAQTTMAAQTLAAQQSVSGVNLDEEAANLLLYQHAYQAAAKAMQIANTMFDSLLAIKQ